MASMRTAQMTVRYWGVISPSCSYHHSYLVELQTAATQRVSVHLATVGPLFPAPRPSSSPFPYTTSSSSSSSSLPASSTSLSPTTTHPILPPRHTPSTCTSSAVPLSVSSSPPAPPGPASAGESTRESRQRSDSAPKPTSSKRPKLADSWVQDVPPTTTTSQHEQSFQPVMRNRFERSDSKGKGTSGARVGSPNLVAQPIPQTTGQPYASVLEQAIQGQYGGAAPPPIRVTADAPTRRNYGTTKSVTGELFTFNYHKVKD